MSMATTLGFLRNLGMVNPDLTNEERRKLGLVYYKPADPEQIGGISGIINPEQDRQAFEEFKEQIAREMDELESYTEGYQVNPTPNANFYEAPAGKPYLAVDTKSSPVYEPEQPVQDTFILQDSFETQNPFFEEVIPTERPAYKPGK